MQRLKLSYCLHSSDTDGLDVDEMVAFAASLDDYHELEPGDIIWAKVTGMCNLNYVFDIFAGDYFYVHVD